MLDTSQEIMKGTTTVGLIFDGGVVLATEMRATMGGNMIASKRAKKIYQITPRIGLTTAGGVGDAQQLVRILQVECNLFEMRRGKTMSVGAASTLLSNYLNQNRYYPYYVQLLMGGFDDEGAERLLRRRHGRGDPGRGYRRHRLGVAVCLWCARRPVSARHEGGRGERSRRPCRQIGDAP